MVGVLGDHRSAVARHGTGDLDRDVVRLAARVDEHDDRELVRQQRGEPVGVGRHLVDEVAGVGRQPLRLRGERRGHPRMGVADLRHVVVRVEEPVAVDVGEPDAVARREVDRLVVAQRERRAETSLSQCEARREADGRAYLHAAGLGQSGRERRRIVLVEQRERREAVVGVGEDVVDVVRVQLGAPGGDEERLGHPRGGELGHEPKLGSGERPDRVVGGDDLDERVERVGAAEGLVGGGDRRVDHRSGSDEVAEVDDAGDALRVVPADEDIAGVDVAVDRRRETKPSDGSTTAS